jgi:hypothetical protein
LRNSYGTLTSSFRKNAVHDRPGLSAFAKSAAIAGFFVCLAATGWSQAPSGRPQAQQQPREPQVAPIPAGGKWLEFDSKDPMTDVKRARFELEGDNPLRDSDRNPKINVFCENGNYVFGHFVPSVKVRPDHPSFWVGRPQVEVRVRADGNLDNHGWNWNGTFLDMDKDSVRRLAGATVFKIELPGPGSPDNIATFSPSGLNLSQFGNACHLKPKR